MVLKLTIIITNKKQVIKNYSMCNGYKNRFASNVRCIYISGTLNVTDVKKYMCTKIFFINNRKKVLQTSRKQTQQLLRFLSILMENVKFYDTY